MNRAHRVALFGCGYVGGALAERLHADGVEVTAVRRSAGTVSGVQSVSANLAIEAPAIGTTPDAAVFSVSADKHDETSYRLAYVTALENALLSLRRVSFAGRFIFVSSTSVYGEENGEWVDETTPARSLHFSGKTLLEAEELVRSSGFHSTIVRLSGIYGPGRVRLINEARNAESIPEGGGYTNRIHRDDCAAMLRFLVHGNGRHDLYLGTDDEPALRGEVLRWISERLGRAPRAEPAATRSRESTGSRGNKRCSNKRIREEGYSFLFPTYREGYGALLAAGAAVPPP